MTRANDLGQPAWAGMFAGLEPAAEGLKPGLSATIAADLEMLARRWPGDLPTGWHRLHAEVQGADGGTHVASTVLVVTPRALALLLFQACGGDAKPAAPTPSPM